ncbi:hypothetical protein [Alienimonas sp. DA493]|uniref:hypothetical protein n=1 Tax=Alienimonas sp. DA493 TaxID=3373605 RepID=UPI003754AE76
MPRLAATLSAPAVAIAALAAAHAGAAVGAAAPSDADGVVRLHVPAAAPQADAADSPEGVVIRAQNRGGRGFGRSHDRSSEPARPTAQPTAPPVAPAPVRPVSGVVESHPVHSGPVHHGPVHSGPVHSGPVHSGTVHHPALQGEPHGGYADCPTCYGHCPPHGCPTCFGVPGLPMCPPCGLFGRAHGAFHHGGTFVPEHRYEYSYDAPKGLLYPPGADPRVPGKMGPMPVVQYPYYTTKGPDDYFHDRDGEF